jgi:hypothetical protein
MLLLVFCAGCTLKTQVAFYYLYKDGKILALSFKCLLAQMNKQPSTHLLSITFVRGVQKGLELQTVQGWRIISPLMIFVQLSGRESGLSQSSVCVCVCVRYPWRRSEDHELCTRLLLMHALSTRHFTFVSLFSHRRSLSSMDYTSSDGVEMTLYWMTLYWRMDSEAAGARTSPTEFGKMWSCNFTPKCVLSCRS